MMPSGFWQDPGKAEDHKSHEKTLLQSALASSHKICDPQLSQDLAERPFSPECHSRWVTAGV